VAKALSLDELAALPVEVLTAEEVAPLCRMDGETIRGQARECPDLLGFPVIVAKRQVRIPKRPFIRFMREGIAEW